MNLKNKALSAGMSLALAVSMMAVPAFAAEPEAPAGTHVGESGTGGTVPVELTVEAPTFSVTVPTALPISVDADGVNTYATDAEIKNLSAGPVKVTNLEISGAGWETVDYVGTDMTTIAVNTKSVALNINGAKTVGPNAINFMGGTFNVMTGKDGTAPNMAIDYDAKLPVQSVEINGDTIANVVFTIAWDEVAP